MEPLTEQELYELAMELRQRISNGAGKEVAKEVWNLPNSVHKQLLEFFAGPNWPPEDVK